MPSPYGRSIAAVVFLVALTFSPYVHAADARAGINDPFTDTIQLWSTLLNVIDSVAYQLASAVQPPSSLTPRPQTPKAGEPSVAASALATESPPETAPSSGLQQAPSRSLPEAPAPTISASPAFAPANVFVTQDQLNAALSNRINPLIGILGDLAALLPSLSASSAATPQWVAANGNPQILGPAAPINQLSNVTITNPTISGLAASAIPDLSGSYLSLGGGALSGAFLDSGSASSSFAGALGIGTTSPSDMFALNGAAYFADITAPGVTTNRLYSNSGSLYWAGSLIGGGGIGNWTISGGNVYRASGNVGVHTASPSYVLDVAGFINTDQNSGYKQNGVTILQASSTPQNLIVGPGAGASLQSSSQNNVAIGYNALAAMATNTTDVAVGNGALQNSVGHANDGFGENAGAGITTVIDTIAMGNSALNNLDGTSFSTGFDNVALGIHSEGHMGAGYYDTAVGNYSMVGCGYYVGETNATCVLNGGQNTALGQAALGWIGGNDADNTGIGFESGLGSFGATKNTFLGSLSGTASSTGSDNIAIGYNISTPFTSSSNTLNIGNLLYGTGMTSNGASSPAGFIGIGTSSPSSLLQIASINPTLTVENAKTSGGTSKIVFQDDAASGAVGTISESWTAAGFTFTSPRDNLNQSGFHFDSNSGTERMTIITSNGNVGIGTTSPYAQLSLAGTSGASTPLLSVSSSTSAFATSTVFANDQNGNTTIGGNGSVLTIGGATTTASKGINLVAGCFAIGGNCLSLANISGTLTINQGGTGTTTWQTNSIPYYNGTTFTENNTNFNFNGTTLSAPLFAASQGSGTSTVAFSQGFTIGGSQFLVQQGSGNVGIGTSTPSTLLHIAGINPGFTIEDTKATGGTNSIVCNYSPHAAL